MQPEDHPDPTRPPPSRQTNGNLISLGAVLIGTGVIFGGAWTYLINEMETTPGGPIGTRDRWHGIPLATILTLVGTIGWISGGVVLVMKGFQFGPDLGQTAKSWWPTALLLLATAICGYIFGFLSCLYQISQV
jgi:hypothetical protein